jgi:P-type Mg2+ transporter
VSTTNALTIAEAGSTDAGEVLLALETSNAGLTQSEAARRTAQAGPNVLEQRGVRPWAVLGRQFNNPLLILLAAAALASIGFGQGADAVIILVIIGLSVALGFVNEYRSERAILDLHARIEHTTIVVRDGGPRQVAISDLVIGDIVMLNVGDVVPADMRLLESHGIECDEAILTGESAPAEKTPKPGPLDVGFTRGSCAYMGTVVRAGAGKGVVVAIGRASMLGSISKRLATRQPRTAFQLGLRDFSMLLVQITVILAILIFSLNAMLGHPVWESLLFTLAVAVGLTPQLLPAIVTASLSAGARRMARRSVIVRRLISIEDFGNIDTLFTDKTGTLTQGRIIFVGAFDEHGDPSDDVLRFGLICNAASISDGQVTGGNALDAAIWEDPHARASAIGLPERIDLLPFDYERRRMSVLIRGPGGFATIVVKGAPEAVFACSSRVPQAFRDEADRRFAAGERIVAVAVRDAPGLERLTAADEHDLCTVGFLVFADPPKADAAAALSRLGDLGIELKLATGDNERVAQKVCADVGLPVRATMIGDEIQRLGDDALRAALPGITIFARISPEQKARLVRLARAGGATVGFLGDGVNDAVALHESDVGISVESAADVAKDAADIVLLDKNLDILADGVMEGRRIFANTIKYVLMGTSSNFGNMLSAASASLFLSFLPMLPSQILLNNLLYDVGEMTIPTDEVDAELLERPSRWDMHFIRRFMLLFGPISSIFDFATFGVMIYLFHATPELFRTGWFVASFSTQCLVIFAIRTRRVPFFKSRPSAALAWTTIGVVIVGISLPFTPFAPALGFEPLASAFFLVLLVMTILYLILVEFAKVAFYRAALHLPASPPRHHGLDKRLLRISSRFRLSRAASDSVARVESQT